MIDYAYDDANRLKEEKRGADRTSYGYNADGLRISQTSIPAAGSQVKTSYLVDPSYEYANVVERFLKPGGLAETLTAVYTFGEGIVSQTIFDNGNTSERFIQSDGFGSTRFLTNGTGAITDKLDYDAFGNELNREGTANVEHLYRGEQFDANLGFYYLRARWMNASVGRLQTMDPFAGFTNDPMSLHKYTFNHNDPINRIGPSGKASLAEMPITINAGTTLRTTSVAVGRRTIGKVLFGHPPKDIGIAGEMILDWMLQGFYDHAQDGGITKQEFGRRVHADVKNRCGLFNPINGVTIDCEPFFVSSGQVSPVTKGSLGVDLLIRYHGKVVIALELKTGKGMSTGGVSKRRRFIGASVIEITLKPSRR